MSDKVTKSGNVFRLDLVKAVIGRRLPEVPDAPIPLRSEIRIFYDYLSDLEGKIQRALAAQEEIDRHTQEQVIDALRALSNPINRSDLAEARSRLRSILMEAAGEYAWCWLELHEAILAETEKGDKDEKTRMRADPRTMQ